MIQPESLIAVVEATWPAATRVAKGAFIIREGQGGGKRVSAASLRNGPDIGSHADHRARDPRFTEADLNLAEASMDALGQDRLFLVGAGQDTLDAALAARGYDIVDPVMIYVAACADLAQPLPPMTAFPHWPPLAAVKEIWAGAGIGSSRIAVMRRCAGAHIALLARLDDQCAGACFLAMSGDIAMLHALEVVSTFRRRGVARNLLHAAASWAQAQGATSLSLVVTRGNLPARQLYASLGMAPVENFHYRLLDAGRSRQEAAKQTVSEI
jgi:GNAT superfamily N-acetyltransferase